MAVAKPEILPLPDVKVCNEVLPDGTVHQKIILRRSSLVMGEEKEQSMKSEILETFDQPPRRVQDFEYVEEVLPDGTKARRKVSLSCMVHTVKTHHESFDDSLPGSQMMEDYEIEEVVPGTTSAFAAGCDSDYENEVSEKGGIVSTKDSKPILIQGTEEIEETLPDGTKVKRRVVINQMVQKLSSHSQSFDKGRGCVVYENYSMEEVIPNTSSAFTSGPDSDFEDENPSGGKSKLGENKSGKKK